MAPDLPGFVLERELGRGGRETRVFLGRPRRRRRAGRVAVKVLTGSRWTGSPSARRFRREIDLLQEHRTHRNVVTLLDHGATRTHLWYAMEYLPGGAATGLVGPGTRGLPPERALAVVLPALRGLAALHEAGVVHRDVSPGNLLLGDGARVVLADLGQARRMHEPGDGPSTLTGALAGTPHFMPREQVTGFKALTPAADVFAMAAVAYLLLTGSLTRTFAGRSVWKAVVEGPVIPLATRRPDLPGGLLEVLDRALSDRPTDRPEDAGQLLRELEQAVSTWPCPACRPC